MFEAGIRILTTYTQAPLKTSAENNATPPLQQQQTHRNVRSGITLVGTATGAKPYRHSQDLPTPFNLIL